MDRRELLKWALYSAGAGSIAISLPLLQSCQPTRDIDWIPVILSQEEARIVENIADVILPGTELLPAASQVHVAEFVDLIVRDCFSDEQKETFISGIHAIDAGYQSVAGKSLQKNISDELILYVENLDSDAYMGEINPEKESYRQLKQLILSGYFTSELVMTEHLNYHAIPGEYRGCIDISQDEKVYVDNNVAG